jgi:hypothetical protein
LSPDRRTTLSKRPSTWVALALSAVGLGMVGFLFVAYASPEAPPIPANSAPLMIHIWLVLERSRP